jgi:O-antigen/teichoic acid export membrane protein
LAGFGWLSQVAGLLVAGAVFLVIGIRYMRRRGYLEFRYDAAKMRSILALSTPLIPHALGGTVIAVSDRMFIERMVGLEAVGLYAVGYSFGMVMSLVTDACMKAWTPWVYRTLALPTEDDKRRIVLSCYGLIASFLSMAGVVAVAAKWILPYMVTKAYQDASMYIGWIALGYAIRGIYQVFFPFIVHIRKTSFLAVSTVIAALLNLLLNYVLIGHYGAIGGAYATAAAFAASATFVFWYQKRNFPMPWLQGVK